jgi:hypothetical protein
MTIKHLRLASILYLLVPNLIFFRFWTNGIIAFVGLLLCGYIVVHELRDKDFEGPHKGYWRDLWVLAVCAVAITCICGISGICYQTLDYWCHNIKFYELYRYDWPIRIPSDGPVIAYYYGFYLVPALYSKMVGTISEQAIFLWTFAGFLLGMSWLYIVLHKKMLFVFLALAIGDLPHVLKTIFYKITGHLYEFGDFGIEAWSNFENLLWVPNQVIPTLIMSGMLGYSLNERVRLERMVLPVALSFWWAVFPAFTCGLLVGVLILHKWFSQKQTFRIASAANEVLLPCLCCAPVLILYLSHEKPPVSGFIWQFGDRMDSRLIEYLINIGINMIVFYLGYRFLTGTESKRLPGLPLYLILFFIAIFPLYRIGKVNDFLFRGLMPLLLIVGLYMYQTLSDPDRTPRLLTQRSMIPVRWAITLLLVASSLIAVARIARAAYVNRATSELLPERVRFVPVPYDAYANIYEVLKARWSQMEADQYLGKQDSVYEKFIAPRDR